MKPAHAACLSAILGMTVGQVAAHATPGVVDLSWGTCSPVISSIGSPAPGPVSVIASVLGSDETHNAFQVRFQLAALDDTVPDAWRFDVPGCQGSARLLISSAPPPALAASCPPFRGPALIIDIKEYSFYPPGLGYPTTTMRGLYATAYPAGQTAVPTQRYFLVEFRFDHGQSVAGPTTPGVNCGGADVPIVVRVQPGVEGTSYLRLSDGIERPFEIGNGVLTVNSAVPAPTSTWGQVKSVYRR